MDNFLTNERDDDILNAQYVIVSCRITCRREERVENIISAKNILFPDAYVCQAVAVDEMRERYFAQCHAARVFLATLIKCSIEEKKHIIFLCTKNESKLKYLKYLSEYVFMEFDYPVYEYKSYSKGGYLIKYSPEKVLKKCNKILEKAKKKGLSKLKESEGGRKKLMEEYSKYTKKELKKMLKKKNLYTPGMSKAEMLDSLEVFM